MMMGLRTASMRTLSNDTHETDPDPRCHVLIRTPLSELRITALRTVMLATQARDPALPRLPIGNGLPFSLLHQPLYICIYTPFTIIT
jgi:hypothetical protein